MTQLFSALLAFWGGLFLTGASVPPERQYYIDVPLNSLQDIRLAKQHNIDIGGVDWEHRLLSLVVKESRLKNFPSSLRILSRREALSPDSRYKQYSHVVSFLKEIERRYPQLAKVYVIGHSVEGKEILAIHLTDQARRSTEKESVLFDSMHHAREIMTPEVTVDIVNYLTQASQRDQRVSKWLSRYNIWVVPMVNPDGNDRVWNTNSMWRKNTRGDYGVDINRNYPYDWAACGGSSGSQYSETYRGAAPASEPETQAILNLAARIKPKFSISYHSYSELVIYPYGCDPKRVPAGDAAIYHQVGKELAEKLVKDSGAAGYKVGTAYDLLYNVDGGSIDWLYATTKTMAFVIEVNSTSAGFHPPFSLRDPTVLRQRAGWQYILDRMEGPSLPSRP